MNDYQRPKGTPRCEEPGCPRPARVYTMRKYLCNQCAVARRRDGDPPEMVAAYNDARRESFEAILGVDLPEGDYPL
jgi:hypothetical protein